MRRIILLLGIMLIALVLSGCGDKGAEMLSPTDITEENSNLRAGEDQEETLPFLIFDWTTDEVLMGHSIQPEDSAQGWVFSLADIDHDDSLEMLITFTANHCGGNSFL